MVMDSIERPSNPVFGRLIGASGTIRTLYTSAQIRNILEGEGLRPQFFSTVHRIKGLSLPQFANVVQLAKNILSELNQRQTVQVVDVEKSVITLKLPPADKWRNFDFGIFFGRFEKSGETKDTVIKACFDSHTYEIDLSPIPSMVEKHII